jgi:hypothetical protein
VHLYYFIVFVLAAELDVVILKFVLDEQGADLVIELHGLSAFLQFCFSFCLLVLFALE